MGNTESNNESNWQEIINSQNESINKHKLVNKNLIRKLKEKDKSILILKNKFNNLNQNTINTNKINDQEAKIKAFINMDPYQALDVNKDINKKNLKIIYKKLVLKYHPDKGGDENIFNKIQKSYNEIIKDIDKKNYMDIKINQEVKKKDYNPNFNKGFENINLNKDNFSINKFNKLFVKTKIEEVDDKGYGHLMDNNKNIKIRNLNENYNNKDFNINNFNDKFNNSKKENCKNKIIQYKEPDALLSNGKLEFSNLGEENIDDFSNYNNGNIINYTDFKKAHITDTNLIDPNQIKIKKYNNVKEYQSERENISYKLNEEDKQYILNKKKEDEILELKRTQRIKNKDEQIFQNFKKYNTLLINR